MAAFRQLLLRGLLAGRRVAMAPTKAPRAFSTTAGGGSHVPQSHRPSLASVLEEYRRVEDRAMYIPTAVTAVLCIGVPIGILGLGPFGSSKSGLREGKSYTTDMFGSSSPVVVVPRVARY